MRWVLFAVTLPYTLTVSWPYVLLACIAAAHRLRFEHTGTLAATWRPWAAKVWRYSTTLGHGIVYQAHHVDTVAGATTPTEQHEAVHVRQVEDQMCTSMLVGLAALLTVGLATGDWGVGAALGAALWWSGGLWQVGGIVASVLRHGFNAEGFYWSTEHERSARAQTERWCPSYASWTLHDHVQRKGGRTL